MEGAETETLSLQDYISSLDKKTLPRILQICSGVYFQGSVYEISGSEVCLSTGDLVKVIGIELQSITCKDISTNETSELPLDYTERFRIIPEEMPFSSIEEMVALIPTKIDSSDTFSFTCDHDMELEGCILPAGVPVSLLSVEHQDGEEEGLARCLFDQVQEGTRQEILVPLSVRGVFYECEHSQDYTVQEIVSLPYLHQRQFRYVKAGRCDGPLHFSPVHSVQAIMHLRKNVVQFPSSLEVDVQDVSECCGGVVFVTPLTLREVALQPTDTFPAVAEVLEVPENARSVFRCRWLPLLRPGQLLVLHGAGDSPLVLASSFKGKNERRHFLLSQHYGGSFRRQPRTFGSAYELYAASCRATPHEQNLTVTVATHWEATAEGLTSLSVGDQLEVLRRGMEVLGCRDDGTGQQEEVEVLVCQRMSDPDEDDDEEDEGDEGQGEEVRLPMYLQGQFVEKLADPKKRYSLAELEGRFSFPLDVKVFRRDPSLEADPLLALSSLQLEETTSECTVVASLLEQPDLLFQLPVRWLTMSISLTNMPLPWAEGQALQPRWESVIEVTDQFCFELRKLLSRHAEAPPPRPPKRRVSTLPSSACSSDLPPPPRSRSLSQSLGNMKLSSDCPDKDPPVSPSLNILDEAPPLIPRKPMPRKSSTQPNMYTKTPNRNQRKERRDSGHDYEEVIEVLKNTNDSIMFY